ncbi:related to DltD N-terminal domain protein [Phialocephala subalpina]|uniref:Related to DltD N-terminal domain protein n=1 Tax=Phialocephala subalpina TaxID=576137 RepID=A0A1L7XA78_9HELO|nr:related to DltD N-terminal domain protein [Phialocephala subalpina]
MTTNRRDVEFKSLDGVTLRAWFYPATSKGPCIIMSHGFSGIKLQNLDNFAQRFQAEGWNTLVYDNRNFGDSDGLPRNEIDPVHQVRDYFDAFDFAASQPEVDATRIAYWGTSLSGGNVICAAAVDKRIKTVIAQTPFVSGEIHTKPLVKMLPGIFANRAGIRGGNPSVMIPVSPTSPEEAESGRSMAILNSPAAYHFMEDMKKIGGNWKNEVTLQSMFNLMAHEPKSFIHRIAPTPFLMVVADDDETVGTDNQLAMYQLALEPKQIHVVRGYSHFGVYDGPGLEENIKVQIEFLRKNL